MAVDFKSFQKLAWYIQVAIVGGVCALLLGLVWYQFLSPMQDDIDAKSKQLADLQVQVAKALEQKRVYEQLKKDSEALEVKLNSLKSVLPLDKEVADLLRSVDGAAKNSTLNLLRFSPRPTIDHEVYTEWPADYEVVGTYHNLGAFLDRIRQLPRIVNVSNIRITSRAAEGEQVYTATIDATYTATTFVYKEESATPPPAKPAGK